MSRRLPVAKTYKLYVGGAFVRWSPAATTARPRRRPRRNVPRGSRKDVRDAVTAPPAARWPAGRRRTAYNRGQILYRAAEALESRAAAASCGGGARREIDAAVDVLVHYAGWTDKLHAVLGGVNPVAAPFLSFSLPEPTGVVGVVAPDEPTLLGLVAEIAPRARGRQHGRGAALRALAAAAARPRRGAGRVRRARRRVNLLSGPALGARARRSPGTATSTRSSTPPATPSSARLDRLAAESVTRVAHAAGDDYSTPPARRLSRIEPFVELKTAWHPVGT